MKLSRANLELRAQRSMDRMRPLASIAHVSIENSPTCKDIWILGFKAGQRYRYEQDKRSMRHEQPL